MSRPEDEPSSVQVMATPRETDDFLERLQTDDEFRERLEADPRTVLAEYHIEVPEELIDGQVSLPSPREVAEARRAISTGQFDQEANAFVRIPKLFHWFRFRAPGT